MSEMRLIDANALKDRLAKHQSILDFEWDNNNLIVSIIDNAPTVVACSPDEVKAIIEAMVNLATKNALENRPKGEWKLIRVADHCGIHDSFVCPFCNYEREYRKKNFCEECGADLRGKKDERKQEEM